jgi:hypothetical protein
MMQRGMPSVVTGGPQAPPNKRVFSIADFCQSYGIGRTRAYAEIKAGRLRIIKAGRRSLIPIESAEAWLAALPRSGDK